MSNYRIFETEVYILIFCLLKLKSEFNKLIFMRAEILICNASSGLVFFPEQPRGGTARPQFAPSRAGAGDGDGNRNGDGEWNGDGHGPRSGLGSGPLQPGRRVV